MNEDYEWDQACRNRLKALSNSELAKELNEILNSKNGFAYTPGGGLLLSEVVKRLSAME